MNKFTKKRIRLVQDDFPNDPRNGLWDNVTRMYCLHRRYDLGDNDETLGFAGQTAGKVQRVASECKGTPFWSSLKHMLVRDQQAVAIFPLYLYDHSSLTVKIGDFGSAGLPQGHCQFDTMRLGFIYTTWDLIRECHPDWKRFSPQRINWVRSVMDEEVETYNQYLNNDVWGFVVEELACEKCGTWESVDSCYGFYGSDWKTNGVLDHISEYITQGIRLYDSDMDDITPELKGMPDGCN